MRIFVTGTGTDVGKTLVCSWLCAQTGYDYFKPVQTGSTQGCDSDTVKRLTGVHVFPESYVFSAPLSPHLAARLENAEIAADKIVLPASNRLIIEGAGGVMVPVNKSMLMLDLMQVMTAPVILVAASGLGTINHTLLSLMALRARQILVAGVIVSGPHNPENCAAIADYGNVPILAALPQLATVNGDTLRQIPLTDNLKKILE